MICRKIFKEIWKNENSNTYLHIIEKEEENETSDFEVKKYN